MTLKQLEYVVKVAECGTVSGAAKALFVAQPSLSAAIQELESEMHLTLFHRTNKGVIVTKEGEVFLSYARQILEQTALLEDQAEKYLQLNNAALEGKPADLVVTTHVCRGNYHSTWASSGGYAPIAPILFAKAHVDGFYLEFDDARSGDFAPLQFVAPGKKVVLGLVTTKSPVLEDPEAVKARIAQAAELVPLENLCLSPQCGFASCEIGNKLTDDEQWAKLDLVRTVARQVW